MLFVRLPSVVFGALLLLAARLAHAQSDQPRAQELFRQGNEAFAEGRVHRALDAYRAAWLLSRSFDIACNLGRAEAELGMSRAAAEHLDYCLKNFPASGRADLREAETRFRELFERVRSLIAVITPLVEPRGAVIALDGERVGLAPLGTSLFVDPGRHELRASLEGYTEGQRVIEARAGETHALKIVLERAPSPASETPAPAPPTTVPPASPPVATPTQREGAEQAASLKWPLVLSGAGLTLVGLGVSTFFLVRAGEHGEDADQLRDQLGGRPGACSDPAEARRCAELEDAVRAQDADQSAATIGYVATGVVAAATLGAWLLWPEPARGNVALSVGLAPGRAGFELRTRF